ncbi:MAG: ABC-F family ATP-binding cassette domain-containing protein [Anaerolineaceae bacterium]|nr:ABC-F family ATP-binding cassette domain-containing protein [Anaerolineaceae bacterium]
MFTIHHLSKSYGLNPVLRNINFSLNKGERAALVGPNGCGKSTLLNIIAGKERADSGQVTYHPSGLRIGYLHQGIEFAPGETVGGYLNQFASNLQLTLVALEEVSQALTKRPNDPALATRYDKVLKDLTQAQEMEGARKSILEGFDLLEVPQETPVETLSGGQKVRLALAGVLLEGPQLLLLDEPTNHLDLEMRNWLQDWVLSYQGGILLVSHDRAFLDAVIHKVIAFPPTGEGIREYPGNYTAYLEARSREFEDAMTAYTDQQDEIRRLKKAARSVRDQAKFRKGGKADPNKTDGFSAGFFADRSQGTVQRAKNLEKRVDYLEGEGKLEKPSQAWEMRMHFTDIPQSGQIALTLSRLSIGYDGTTLLPPITQTVTLGQRIALVGPNGIGKTTLFKTLLGETPPLDGSFHFGAGVHPGYLSQEQEMLDPAKTVLETIQALPDMGNHSEARTFLHRFLFAGDEVFQPVTTLSYGQRSRLMLAMLVAQHCNFLLLDEPLNHLDLPSRESFEASLSEFDGTILAIAHDQYFIDRFAQVIWHFAPEGLSIELTGDLVSQIMDS